MAQSKDTGGSTTDVQHVLSERGFALFDEPILNLSESGELKGLNQSGIAFLDAIPDEIKDKVRRTAEPALSNGRPIFDQFELKVSKEPQTVQLTAIPLKDGHAHILLRDITLETSLRLALVDSRQRYKDFVEISADFSWETNSDRQFAFVSPRGGLGYSADELVSLSPQDLVMDYAHGGPNPFLPDRRIENSEVWLAS